MRKIDAHTREWKKMTHEQKRWIEERDATWNTIPFVHPGEAFPLFHPARNGTTTRRDDNGLFRGMASRVRLQTGPLAPLDISIAAAPYALQKAAVITPFDRHQGYPLDQEDFLWRSRYKKITRMKQELAAIVEGLSLVVFAAYEDLTFQGAMSTMQENGSPCFAPELASLLKYLFLTLTFPDGASFTAKAQYNTNRLFLLFRTFFPTDTGPLPVGEDSIPLEPDSLSIEEGFRLLLPFDAEQVQAIRAKFLLLPGVER